MSLLTDKIELEVEEAELSVQKKFSGYPSAFKIILICCLIALIPGYFIAKGLAHGYWRKYYQTYAVVAQPSFTNPLPPKVAQVVVTSTGNNNFSVIAEITNPNLTLSAENLPAIFTLYNAEKQAVYSQTDPIELLPNSDKFVVVPKINLGTPIASATLTFPTAIQWENRLNIPTVTLTTSLPTGANQINPTEYVVSGDVTNQSSYTLSALELTFVLYNSSGQIIGGSSREEDTVAPNERRAYVQIWPGIYSTDVAKIFVQADTDVLNPSNLTVSPIQNPAAELSRPTPTP